MGNIKIKRPLFKDLISKGESKLLTATVSSAWQWEGREGTPKLVIWRGGVEDV